MKVDKLRILLAGLVAAALLPATVSAQTAQTSAVQAASSVASFYDTMHVPPIWFRGGSESPAVAQLIIGPSALGVRRLHAGSAASRPGPGRGRPGAQRQPHRYRRGGAGAVDRLGPICPGHKATHHRHDLRVSGARAAGLAGRPDPADRGGCAFARSLCVANRQRESDLRAASERGLGGGSGERKSNSRSAPAGKPRSGSLAARERRAFSSSTPGHRC